LKASERKASVPATPARARNVAQLNLMIIFVIL
jgi:hypothetical protein